LDGETCDYETVALDFAALVRLAGERRPEGYPKGCRGLKLQPPEAPAEEFPVPTLAAVFGEYVETLVDAEPRTVAEYQRDFRSHVQPATVKLPGGKRVGPLGGLPIDQCDSRDIWQGWVGYMRAKTYGKKTKKHYAPKTIINIHGAVISPLFDFAVFRGYCRANPGKWIKLPERKGRPIKAHHVLVTAGGRPLSQTVELCCFGHCCVKSELVLGRCEIAELLLNPASVVVSLDEPEHGMSDVSRIPPHM
jgi:hypothetical protein